MKEMHGQTAKPEHHRVGAPHAAQRGGHAVRASVRASIRALPFLFAVTGCMQLAAQRYPDQNCVATMENRSVPVAPNGTYIIPNVPVNEGQYRARVICQQPDGTVLGSTSNYISLTPNGSTPLPLLPLTGLTAQPSRLKVQAISGALTSLGATVQLETQAINPSDFAYDYTPLTQGTTYSSSNIAVATVDGNGLVTATGPGTVFITARNDGLASTITLSSFGSLDSDGDGIPDAYEIANGMNPYDPTDAALDSDGDGLTNLQEFQLGTNPRSADTDGDGLSDGDEIKRGTNPLVADTDGDGLSDGDEVRLGTNPLVADTDGDGIPDGVEVKIGTNPLVPDATTTVTGHVTNPNGTPYVGASVVVFTYFTGTTDNTGAFSLLKVPATLGSLVVSARAVVGTAVYSGASAAIAPAANGVTDVGTIQLGQSAGQVSGTITSPDNSPVAGVQVAVVNGADTRTTVTDGSGIYLVAGLQSGTITVAAFDPATSLRGQATGVLNGGGPLVLNVKLAGFGTVSGTVRDASGTPVGAAVAVTISGALNASTVTDTVGHYSFNFVPLGGYRVSAADTDGNLGQAAGVITATAQTIRSDIQFLGRGTVSGTVKDATGNAVGGVAMALSNRGLFAQQLSSVTNSLGQYSFSKVFVGNVDVTATSTAANTGSTASGALTKDGQTVTIDLTLQPTATVSGTVSRKSGAAVSGATVSLDNTAFTATANTAGVYSIANVPLGTYTVQAADPASTDRGSASAALTTAGQTVTANVTMVGTGTLVVTVQDGTGANVSGARVEVNGSGPYNQNQTAVTDSSGTATFNQQLAGAVSIRATNPATGLGGTANATVTAGVSAAVTVHLQPFGSVTGKVYQSDAATVVPGAIVVLDGNGQQVLTDSSGSYTLTVVPAGTHLVQVLDSLGNVLAYNNNVVLSTQGQTATANFVIVGRGTVTGLVTLPDSTAAAGIPVQVTSSAAGANHAFGTQTDVRGMYTVPLVPVGGYVVVAQQHTASINLYGTATGTMPSNGATVTTNVQLSSTVVPSTNSLTDANGFVYPIRQNGGLYDGSFGVFSGDGAANEGGSVLSLVDNGTVKPFVGAAFSTSSLEARQISIEQDGLAGLNVVRRVYVPQTGYFARYLELLTNPGSQAITVGVQLSSNFRQATENFRQNGTGYVTTELPHVLLTSSGDTVLNVADPNTPDNWVTFVGPTDRDPFLSDQFADTPIPAIADVFTGPGATLRPTTALYTADASNNFSTLSERFTTVRVPAGGTVGILHFVSQQNRSAAANASAQRLVQLPPEALTGLSTADLAAISNFAVPAGGASAVAALPALTSQITGFVYASDHTTLVPGASVFLQSSDPIYARVYATGANANGAYSFQGSLGGAAIPAENYSVYASHPITATPISSDCAQNGHFISAGCTVDSPATTGSFASSTATQSTADITFSNTGIVLGTISRGPTVLNVSGTVTFTGPVMAPTTIPVLADGTYKLTGVLPGTYTITASVTNTLLQGITTTTVAAGQTVTANITIGASGSVQGTVTRADGSLAVNDTVNLRATGVTLQALVDTSGHYAFTDIPAGTYTVDVYDGQSNAAATATVVVTANATTTQNLLLQSSGTVLGTVTVNDGSSVAGLLVTLASTTSSGTQSLTTSTDSAGKFTFNGVKPGSISVHTTTSGGLQGTGNGSLPLAGQTVTINIGLVSAGNVTGTVYQGDGTTPAAGIQVTISPAPLTGSASTTTAANGGYSFSNEAFGGFTVYATNAANGDLGQGSSQIQANGQLRTVNITLNGFGTLVVKVVDSSTNKVPNAAVTVHNQTVGKSYTGTTDATGTATFSNIYARAFDVTARDPVTGLSAQTTGTLAVNATQTVTLTLQAVGTIQGTVFAPNGTTPVAGATVQLNAPYGPTTTTATNGSYQFTSVQVGGSYSFQARDASGLVRASAPGLILQSSGQVITQNLTFVGVGSVSGVVKNVDGTRANNLQLTVLSRNASVGGSQTVTTGGDGTYSVAEVPVGVFTVTVNGLPSNLAGFGSGAIAADGDHQTLDIQIQSSTVSLPVTLTDADGFPYVVQTQGVFSGANSFFGFYPFYSAQALGLVVNGTSANFGDNSSPTTALQSLSGQQIEINQPSLAGLNVTRKIYVPSDGYFARRLEVLQNDTSSPVTATVQIISSDRFSTLSPQVIKTSSGNTTVDNTILWAVDDDDSGKASYPASQPAHANVFAGTGAPTGMDSVTRSSSTYPGYGNNPSYTQQNWVYKYQAVTIPAKSKVSFLFFTAQEASASTAITAAQRLVQLPAEALAGLTSDELSSIKNFVVPSSPLAALHPPTTSAVLSGTVQTGDGLLPVPNATVYAQSTDLQYGGGVTATSSVAGAYTLPTLLASSYAVQAVDPSTGVTSTTFTGNFTGGSTTQAQDIPFTNTGILSGIVKATGNGQIGTGTIYVSMSCSNGTSTVYCGTASQNFAADGSFRFLTILAGTPGVAASIYTPTGGYIYLPRGSGYYGVDLPARQTTSFTFTIPASGTIRGKVTNADGTAAPGVTVYVTPSDYNKGISSSTKTASDGTYSMNTLLLDTYTVSSIDPITQGSVSKTTTLTQDSVNTVDLTFIGRGDVAATVKYANGNIASGVSLYIWTSTRPTFTYSGTSDSNGQFTFTSVPTGAFSIRAYYPNQGFYSTTTGTISGTGSTQQLAVTLTPVGTISGKLSNADGTGASGQYVSASDSQNTYNASAATDSAGNYALYPVPADRAVTVTSSTYSSTLGRTLVAKAANQQVPGDGQTLTVNLRYPGAANVKVTVLQSNGTPYTSGAVYLKSSDGAQNYSHAIGSDGSYTFTNVLEAAFVAYASVDYSNYPVGSKVFTVALSDVGQTVQVTLNTAPKGTVKGQVFAADGTTVIHDNYYVQLTDTDTGSSNSSYPGNEEGYSFTDVRNGAGGFTLTAQLNNLASSKQSVTKSITTEGQVITQNFTLPVSSISGTVFLYGGTTPVPFSNIQITQTVNGGTVGYYTTADANGRYQVSGATAGQVSVTADDDNGVHGSATTTLATDTSIVSGVNVTLPATGTVTGTVYSSAGQILANTSVDIQSSSDNGGFSTNVDTDSNGNYTATDIPVGNITVSVYDQVASMYLTAGGVLNHNGDTVVINVGNVPSSGGRAFGTVYDGNSDPVSGVPITVTSSADANFTANTTTDEDGKYSLSGLPLGDVTVTAKYPDGSALGSTTGTIVNTDDAVEIDVGLTDVGNVSGKVVDQDGNALAGYTVTLASTGDESTSYSEASGDDGAFYFSGVSPGKVTVHVLNSSNAVIGTSVGNLPFGGNLTLTVAVNPAQSAGTTAGTTATQLHARVAPASLPVSAGGPQP